MKLVAFYCVYNETDFLKYSLRSIYNYIDRIIIIEGSWRETFEVNGHMRSNDGTLDIIKNFPDPNNKIELHSHNEDSQIKQRNTLWQYLNEDCALLLVDGDEIYTEKEIKKVRDLVDKGLDKNAVYTINSKTFVNDLYTYTPIRFPRLWIINHKENNVFVYPNDILKNGKILIKIDLDIFYHHYSYCHSPKRFIEKKKERTKLHGDFSWDMEGDLVQKLGVKFETLPEDELPNVMKLHPLAGVKKHKEVSKSETIVYVEHSGIGNLVLSTPMLRALRTAKPDAHIHVVAWKRSLRILEGLDCIDSIIPADEPNKMAHLYRINIDHLLISPIGAVDPVVNWLSAKSKKVHKILPMNPWTVHEAERKMILAKQLGYKGPTPKCTVPVFDYNIQNAYNFLFNTKAFNKFESPTEFIAINAAYLRNSHWNLKHFGDMNYVELIDKIHNEYPELRFVFVGNQLDSGDASRIVSWTKVPLDLFVNACGFSDDIKDTAALLSQAVLCIGNDGGLQHIAAAVGKSTVSIFTFTNPVKNKPFKNDGIVVMVPCLDRLTCQHGNFRTCRCLQVPVDQVFIAFKELLEVVRSINEC